MQSLTTLASSLNARVGAQRCSAISVQILTRRNSMACSIHSGVRFNASTQHSYPLRDANSLYKGLNLALTFGSSIEYPILLREGDVRDKSNPASPPIVLRDETSLPRQTQITVLALGGDASALRNQAGTLADRYRHVRARRLH